jgi:hypothetical protein
MTAQPPQESKAKSSVLPTAGGQALLDPSDSVILLLDHQSSCAATWSCWLSHVDRPRTRVGSAHRAHRPNLTPDGVDTMNEDSPLISGSSRRDVLLGGVIAIVTAELPNATAAQTPESQLFPLPTRAKDRER